jgi:hypothetical protein
MNWIEKIIGISPDGGNGTMELLLVFVVAVFVATGIVAMRSRVRYGLPKR